MMIKIKNDYNIYILKIRGQTLEEEL